jgi:hypothetical protein
MSKNLKSLLIPYKLPFKKIRIGRPKDGGYVIFDTNLDKVAGLYSYGISDDVSFELDFVEKYNVKCYMFDHTIDKLPNTHANFIFTKEPGNSTTILKHVNLTNPDKNNLFLKMDIEGHEWELFNNLSIDDMVNFEQIVIEMHNLQFLQNQYFGNMGITNEKMEAVLSKINTYFYLGHIHGNNCGGIKDIPNTVECTYIRKDLVPNTPSIETISYPIDILDFPNNVSLPDYVLNWWLE